MAGKACKAITFEDILVEELFWWNLLGTFLTTLIILYSSNSLLASRALPCSSLVNQNVWQNSLIFNRVFLFFRDNFFVSFKSITEKKASCFFTAFFFFSYFLRALLLVSAYNRRKKGFGPRNIKPPLAPCRRKSYFFSALFLPAAMNRSVLALQPGSLILLHLLAASTGYSSKLATDPLSQRLHLQLFKA